MYRSIWASLATFSMVCFLVLEAVCQSPVEKGAAPKQPRIPGTAVYGMALSSDEKWLVTGGDDSISRMWEVGTGKLVRAYLGHEKGWISTVALSPDAKLLATGSGDETARLWDVQSGKELHVFKGHDSRVNGVAFSHDGKWLASCGNDGKARIWDLTTKKELRSLQHTFRERFGPTVGFVFFSPDDKWLLTGAADHARIWNIATGKLEHEHDLSYAVSKDCQWFIRSNDREKKSHIVALGKGAKGFENVASQPYSRDATRINRSICMVASAGEGKWVLGERETIEANGTGQGVAYLVDFATGKDIQSFKIPVKKGGASHVTEMVLSADGKRLFTASWDGKARLWDVATGQVIRVFGEPAEKAP
jgi:WD40 repeat protein